MRHIVIDCRFAGGQTGLGRYTRNIVSELLKIDQKTHYTLLINSEAGDWVQRLTGNFDSVLIDIPHYSLAEQTKLPSLIRELNADLYFSPHFNVPYFCPIPFVCVIHDLILHRFPSSVSPLKRLAYKVLMRRAVNRAKKIVAVSQFTKAELGTVYSSKIRNKSEVVGEGVESFFKPTSESIQAQVCKKYGIERPFLFYVGNAKPHKNVQMLIDSLGDSHLVLVTGGKESKKLSLTSHCTLLPSVEDADLPALYSSAQCFVSASLYEGYGLSFLEARACGCPIIGIHGSAVSEVAGDDAVLVDLRIETLADALQVLPSRVESRLKLPSWGSSAKSLLQVLTPNT